MKMTRNITIVLLSFFATSAVVIAAQAQATTSVTLTLTQKSFAVSTDDQARVNLIKEIQKVNPAAISSGQLEIQMIRLTAKAGIGGAQFFLRINNDFVDSQSIETDPDQFVAEDMASAQKVELKNIERDKITEASFIIQGFSNAKISSVEVVLGPVTEVAILGHYADEQVAMVSGGVSVDAGADIQQAQVVKPSAQALADINTRYYTASGAPSPSVAGTSLASQMAQTLQNAAEATRNGGQQQPAVVATTPTVASSVSMATTPVKKEGSQPQTEATVVRPVVACATNRRGARICVGDKVHNRWGFSGIVQDLRTQDGQNTVLVKFGFGDIKWRDVDSISK